MKMKMKMGGRKMVAMRMIISLIMVANAQAHQELLDTLCGAATYKEACTKSLQSAAHSQGATPQMLVERGVKLALDEINKATSKLDFKADPSCKHLLEQAKERLQGVMTQVCNANSFKDPAQLLDLRIKLGDVNTFTTTCVDEAPPQLQQIFKDGTNYATQLSVNMLDVVTVFNQDLSHKLLTPTNRRLLAFS